MSRGRRHSRWWRSRRRKARGGSCWVRWSRSGSGDISWRRWDEGANDAAARPRVLEMPIGAIVEGERNAAAECEGYTEPDQKIFVAALLRMTTVRCWDGKSKTA